MLLSSFTITLALKLLSVKINVMMVLLTCSLRKKGAASFVLKESPKAIVTHCCSHNSNLSLALSCKNPEIDNVLKTYKAITIFFNSSPKREGLLEHIVKSRCIGAEKRKVLVCAKLVGLSVTYLMNTFILQYSSWLKPLR